VVEEEREQKQVQLELTGSAQLEELESLREEAEATEQTEPLPVQPELEIISLVVEAAEGQEITEAVMQPSVGREAPD
jgi:hypothetical protein